MRSSLRARLMSLFGTLALITFFFCASSVVYFVYRAETAAWNSRQHEAAVAASQTVSNFIVHADDVLSYIAQLSIESLTSDVTIVQAAVGPHDEILEVIRVDAAEGSILAHYSRDRVILANLFTIPLSQWYQRASKGERFYGDIQISSREEPYIILAVPASDGGVVAARLDMGILWSSVAGIHFGDTGKAYVISQNGQIIAHTNTDFVLSKTSIRSRPEFNAVIQSSGYQWFGEYTNYTNQAVVGVTAPVEVTGWIVITELEQSEAYTATRTAVIVLGGGFLLFMSLLVIVSRFFLISALLRPMDQLRLGAERIVEGDLDYRIEIQRGDEIGLVAQAFDEMASKLRNREQELAAQTIALAQEIAERIETEQALRMSEARYRAIVEDQTELICRYVDGGVLTFVNEAYCRYFNKTQIELVGHTFMPLVPEEDQQSIEAQISLLGDHNTVVKTQHRVILESGEIRWMEWVDRAVLDSEGHIIEIQAVGRDVTDQHHAEEEIRRLNADLERRVVERTQQLISANEDLQSEIVERKRIEAELRRSEERLQLAMRAAKAGAWEWNMTTNEAYWSEENFYVMGLEPSTTDAHFDNWLKSVHPDDRNVTSDAVKQAIENHTDLDVEFRVIWPDGTVHWVNDIGKMTFDSKGHPIGMYGIQMDITERKRATEKIRASLQEKEILLKEIHHRVKNNLQIISSLLNLQSNAIDDPDMVAQFRDSQNRIQAMSLIHERLYRSEDLARVDFKIYLGDLTESLIRTYRRRGQNVKLCLDIDVVSLDIDTAIPCGLIVNELVSNALKHAFKNRSEGCIGVELRSEDQYRLVVWDDGIGFPVTFDYKMTSSLGLQLVNSLVHQLNGTINLSQETGTRFEVIFPGVSQRLVVSQDSSARGSQES